MAQFKCVQDPTKFKREIGQDSMSAVVGARNKRMRLFRIPQAESRMQ